MVVTICQTTLLADPLCPTVTRLAAACSFAGQQPCRADAAPTRPGASAEPSGLHVRATGKSRTSGHECASVFTPRAFGAAWDVSDCR